MKKHDKENVFKNASFNETKLFKKRKRVHISRDIIYCITFALNLSQTKKLAAFQKSKARFKISAKYNLTPKGAPKSYVDLMNQCLNDNPKLRPSITQIVNTLGKWYLEAERNIDTQIVTEFRMADEFRQASQMEELDKKLKINPDVIPLMDKDISAGSLLSIIHKLGVDLIDINQFADRKCIKEDPNYPYDKRSDIYSFGVLMWEISSGKCPFDEGDPIAASICIIKGGRVEPIQDTPDDYRDLYVD
ncbi:10588_t:CDS:2, partial [Racocetra fulgida]